MNNIFVFLKLIRVRQWIKNTFVLAPLVFSGRFVDPAALHSGVVAFIAFCFISSGLYIINDLADIRRDKLHPKKCLRPLANGRVSRRVAIVLAGGLVTSGIGTAFFLGYAFTWLTGLYLMLHGMYNFAGKKIVLVDIGCIALGFCIRVLAGATAVGVVPSGWLLICVFLLALFLGFAKRRSEKIVLEGMPEGHRPVLQQYSLYVLDRFIIISAVSTIFCYGLYTISADILNRVHGYAMTYSAGFVAYGIFRYLYLIYIRKMREDAEEILLKDLPSVLNMVAWVGAVLCVLYPGVINGLQ